MTRHNEPVNVLMLPPGVSGLAGQVAIRRDSGLNSGGGEAEVQNLSTMPEVLNPDIQIALQAAVAYLADTVTAGEREIGIPLSGAYLNGFVFSCGRARLIASQPGAEPNSHSTESPKLDPEDDPGPDSLTPQTLEIALLGAHRDGDWRHSFSGTAVLLPEDRSAGSPDLLRRLSGGLQEVLADTVSTGFAQRWNPDWLEKISTLENEIGMTRGFLDVAGEAEPDEAELDGHLFRRVAGHWTWIGRAQ